jgi:hypothetical protein
MISASVNPAYFLCASSEMRMGFGAAVALGAAADLGTVLVFATGTNEEVAGAATDVAIWFLVAGTGFAAGAVELGLAAGAGFAGVATGFAGVFVAAGADFAVAFGVAFAVDFGVGLTAVLPAGFAAGFAATLLVGFAAPFAAGFVTGLADFLDAGGFAAGAAFFVTAFLVFVLFAISNQLPSLSFYLKPTK